MMHYKTHGTCSTAIDLEIEGGKEQTDAAVADLKQTPHIIVRRDSDHA